jgi:uncharacterized protein
MLLIKTIVKPSAIAGMGLFADEDIERGEKIWKYSPNTCVLLTQMQMETLMNSAQHEQIMQYYLTYGWCISQLGGLAICLDNARFFNHSVEPNSGQMGSLEEAWQYSVALRNIAKGEELTENYGTYDSAQWISEMHHNFNVFNIKSRNH